MWRRTKMAEGNTTYVKIGLDCVQRTVNTCMWADTYKVFRGVKSDETGNEEMEWIIVRN